LPTPIVDAVAQQHKLAIRTSDAAQQYSIHVEVPGGPRDLAGRISNLWLSHRRTLSEFFGFGNAAIVCLILYGFVSICGFLATN
jgi:hypothetical protein